MAKQFVEVQVGRGSPIASAWMRRGDHESVLVLPDGRTDLLFRGKDGRWTAEIVGPHRRALQARASSEVFVGIRLEIGAAPVLLDVPAIELAERLLPASDVTTRTPSIDLVEAVARGDRPLTGLVEDITRRARSSAFDPELVTRIGSWRGGVAGLARGFALSTRHLRRLFEVHVGLSPIRLARIQRFQRALAARPRCASWAEVAATAGYADEAHLSRDANELTSLTPSRVFAAMSGSFNSGHLLPAHART